MRFFSSFGIDTVNVGIISPVVYVQHCVFKHFYKLAISISVYHERTVLLHGGRRSKSSILPYFANIIPTLRMEIMSALSLRHEEQYSTDRGELLTL